MIIYEVNLTIQTEIYNDFHKWLNRHIDEMLEYDGFINAKMFYPVENLKSKKKICIQYSVYSKDDLDNYLINHAKKMRGEAINLFGNSFTAKRRIMNYKQ